MKGLGTMRSSQDRSAVLSFRCYLKAKLAQFVLDFSSSHLAADLLAEFIVFLSMYQKEGTDLFPAVFLGEVTEEILKITFGRDPISIGSGPLTRDIVQRAFKHCAPLAEGREWAVFVTIKPGLLSYGIFRIDQSPLPRSPFEALRQNKDAQIQVIGLSRLGRSFVEVRRTINLFKFVNLPGNHELLMNPKDMIRTFMDMVTRGAPKDLKTPLQSFYHRLGADILHSNHGTLLCVVPHHRELSKLFQDGILLEPRIEVMGAALSLIALDSREALQQLLALNHLIRRMAGVGEITILDSGGAIVGYRCFVKDSQARTMRVGILGGGARRRAFDVLTGHLGKNLSGVIYKSQDGLVELPVSDGLGKAAS